ncbi:MAG: methyltransferase domain-containing protein [Verrucomicrobia bacterium]|nr:methyltransferase domain-containing protein [Verrucomicrobiota bacterium]
MSPTLQAESERLARSWERHDAAMLRDYLVADVEDPRLNVQSVLSRHFLSRWLIGDRFEALAAEEIRFAAILNWLLRLSKEPGLDWGAVRHSLRAGADNADGIDLPAFVARGFRELPRVADGVRVPNYLARVLERSAPDGRLVWPPTELDTFIHLWREALQNEPTGSASVLEPACGSANDYRAWRRCGLARLVRYTGFDLSAKNVANARAMFPDAQFAEGNVFDLPMATQSHDFAVIHDLFEHLSEEGLSRAVAEVCRVTRRGLCVSFFNMEERPDHVFQAVEEYHWNRLSMERMRAAFAAAGFQGQVIHIGTFLRARLSCPSTHNSHAYTFLLRRQAGQE